MRLSKILSASIALLFSSISVAPFAHADSMPYPYFRRTDLTYSTPTITSTTVTSTSSVAAVSGVPKVGVHLEADRNEANPGDSVRYWIRITNLYNRDLPSWGIAFFFDPNRMQITDTGGGRIEGDHVTFGVPTMFSGQEISYSVGVHLYNNVQPGDVITTYGSMIWDGSIQPACSKHLLSIISRPPVTGVGDATSPVEDLQQFLTPVSATTAGWMASLLSLFSR